MLCGARAVIFLRRQDNERWWRMRSIRRRKFIINVYKSTWCSFILVRGSRRFSSSSYLVCSSSYLLDGSSYVIRRRGHPRWVLSLWHNYLRSSRIHFFFFKKKKERNLGGHWASFQSGLGEMGVVHINHTTAIMMRFKVTPNVLWWVPFFVR